MTYNAFAKVYDTFMDNIPYDKWAEGITGILEEKGINPGAKICETGCGTGTFLKLLQEAGYDVCGVDLSEDMIEVAKDKFDDAMSDKLIVQNMCELNLEDYQDAIVSVCDSMNYLLTTDELKQTILSCYDNLNEGGVFIFDMKQKDFFAEELGDYTFAESAADCAYIWNNYFDEESWINEYELVLFIENEAGTYDRFDEIHKQRAYPDSLIIGYLEEAGFKDVECFSMELEGFSAETNQERLYFMAVKR